MLLYTMTPVITIGDCIEKILSENCIVKILSENEKERALVQLGCSELVIVVEALLILECKFNEHYIWIGGMRSYAKDLQEIMEQVKSDEGKGTFSRFSYALLLGARQRNPLAKTTGIQIFTEVCEAIARDYLDNQALQELISSKQALFQAICAWAGVFECREIRHKQSHPFACIGGDIESSRKALGVLEYLTPKYESLRNLITASIPVIDEHITQKAKEKQAKFRQEEQEMPGLMSFLGLS